MTAQPTQLTIVAGTAVLALEDALGTERRITLHGNGHYTIDNHGRPVSMMVGHPEYHVFLDACLPEDRLAQVSFRHTYSWDPRYLGYENLWMLVSQYPREFYQGDGKRIRLPSLAEQSRWLTIQRVLVGDLLTSVSFVGPNNDAALRLLMLWLQDRVRADWDGESHNDHTLPVTPIWAELGGDRVAALNFKDRNEGYDDDGRHLAPLVWVYRHDVPHWPGPPVSYTREYLASDENDTAKAFSKFADALRDAGDHWGWPPKALA